MNGEVNLSALETEFDKNELRFLLTHACSRWCHLWRKTPALSSACDGRPSKPQPHEDSAQ